MAPAATRLFLRLPLRLNGASPAGAAAAAAAAASRAARAIHSNPPQPAKVVPVYGTGPPPEPPQPTAEFAAEEREEREERLARRRRQAEMLRQAGDLKTLRQQQQQQQQGSGSAGAKTTQTASAGGRLKRRFWKDVHVREVNGALEIHLDTRPLRHPTTKSIIRLPPSKPHLAHALALEWDSLTSASQATKQHMIPLTSLVCRALDLTADASLRPGVAQTLLRYLDTDSLLCFCPAPSPEESDDHDHDDPAQQLHERQRQAYAETAAYVTARLWPGVRVEPVLEGASIVPRQQAPGTREAVQDWILSLSGFELAGLERATLAGKSLLAAARLVAEWSEEGAAAAGPANGQAGVEEEKNRKRFGVEEAAQAVSLEVTWQTRQWGEVEDTHDVEKEDLRRQLGSVVLLVSGTRKGSESKSS